MIDFFNSIISFVLNFHKNLFDGIKNIFIWIFEKIKNFIWYYLEPFWNDYLKHVYNFFYSFFNPLWEVATRKTDFQTFFWGNQNYICQKSSGFYIDTETPNSMKPSELL